MSNLKHFFHKVQSDSQKKDFILDFIQDLIKISNIQARIIIFFNEKVQLLKIFQELQADPRFSKLAEQFDIIHGDLCQQEKMKIFDKFNNFEINFLLTTYLIPRGIYFNEVSSVINCDIPCKPISKQIDIKTYIHRVSKANLSNEKGVSIQIYSNDNDDDEDIISLEEKLRNFDITIKQYKGFKEIKNHLEAKSSANTSNKIWQDIGISDEFAKQLSTNGFYFPLPSQVLCIPKILEFKVSENVFYQHISLFGFANSRGKTLNFLIPMIQKYESQEKISGRWSPQAIIIADSKDLCLQIGKQIDAIMPASKKYEISYHFKDSETKSVRGSICIGTPSYILKIMNPIKTDKLKFLIVDEADEIFEQNQDELKDILNKIYNNMKLDFQLLLFSATFEGNDIQKLVNIINDDNFKFDDITYEIFFNNFNEKKKEEKVMINQDLGICDEFAKQLQSGGFEYPNFLQVLCIPKIIQYKPNKNKFYQHISLFGFDKGTGKTLCFLTPMIQNYVSQEKISQCWQPQAIIITNSKKLCLQVGKQIDAIMPQNKKYQISYHFEYSKFVKGSICIGTPTYIQSILNDIKTDKLKFLIVDEADKVMQKYQDELKDTLNKIYSDFSQGFQLLLFSDAIEQKDIVNLQNIVDDRRFKFDDINFEIQFNISLNKQESHSTHQEITPQCVTWQDLEINDELAKQLEISGFNFPKPSQLLCIPKILEFEVNFDQFYKHISIFGLAKGTGKTLCFLVPMIQKYVSQEKMSEFWQPQAIIITYSKGLCLQIGKQIESIMPPNKNYEISYHFTDSETKNVKGSICIGTPGYIYNIVNDIQIDKLNFFIIDEAAMVMQLHQNELSSILDQIYKHIKLGFQFLLFSAIFEKSDIQTLSDIINDGDYKFEDINFFTNSFI